MYAMISTGPSVFSLVLEDCHISTFWFLRHVRKVPDRLNYLDDQLT